MALLYTSVLSCLSNCIEPVSKGLLCVCKNSRNGNEAGSVA